MERLSNIGKLTGVEKLSDRWMYYCGLLAVHGVPVDDMKHIQNLIDAEEQGLLLRLPCKYNDSLYWVFDGFVREVWFKGVRCDKGYKPQIIARFIDGSTLEAKEKPIAELENIGKTLFFTKEEAEQALAKMKEV